MRLILLVTTLVFPFAAHGQTWNKDADKALRQAKKAVKPTLVVSEKTKHIKPPGTPLVPFSDTLGALIAAEKPLSDAFAGYHYGRVNCWSPNHRSNDWLDPAKVEKWGKPLLLRVYAPGATKALWEGTLAPEADANAQRAKLLEAAKSYQPTADGLARILSHYKAKDLQDRGLKKNFAAQIELAKLWQRAKSLALALEAYDRAIAATRTRKDGAKKSMQYMKAKAACAVALGEIKTGVSLYRKYLGKYKKASDRGKIMLKICKLLFDSGDKGGAKRFAKAVKADKSLKEHHADANEFLTDEPDDKH